MVKFDINQDGRERDKEFLMPLTVDSVASFGKFIYTPIDETSPKLPNLNILIFREPEENSVFSYSAVCIELELDACGNSMEEVKEELRKVMAVYFNAMARSCSSMDEFAQKIIDTIFSPSKQKDELFKVYLGAKRNYLLSHAQKSNIQASGFEPTSAVSSLFKNNIMELSPVT